jgi:hypothetical protein
MQIEISIMNQIYIITYNQLRSLELGIRETSRTRNSTR